MNVIRKCLFPALLGLALAASPGQASPASQWADFFEDDGIVFLEESDWALLTTNYPMDIGTVGRANYYVAWREGGDIGVMLHYRFTPAVSPPELPRPGPMSDEYVEVTINCAARSSRIHYMYLYGEDGKSLGSWFDPAYADVPRTFGSDSIIGMAAARVC